MGIKNNTPCNQATGLSVNGLHFSSFIKTSRGYIFVGNSLIRAYSYYIPLPNYTQFASSVNGKIFSSIRIPLLTSIRSSGIGEHIALTTSPNPATAEITLRFQPTTAGAYSIDMFDTHGRSVFARTGTSTATEQVLTIPTTHLPIGAYYVRLTTAKGISMKKIIVER